ncbi:hypothetical protein Tco_0671805 [Tanacetum coccineum]
MRTRNSNFPNNSNVTIPRRRNRGRAPNIVEPEPHTIVEVEPMAERTMEELLHAPTKGYGEAIVLPEINADHFEIKTNLLQLVQANPFHGYERENPHAHINSFKRITSTLRFRDVPNDVIKLMMFPYSLKGNAILWMNTTSRESVSKTDEKIDKLADQISTLVEIVSKKVVTPAPVKAVEEICVTCSGPHAWYNCLNIDNNQASVCAATGSEVETSRTCLTLRGQGILVVKVRTGGGDVVRLGAKLERLWCKVEVCGGVCSGDIAAATLRLQGRDVASFRAKR